MSLAWKYVQCCFDCRWYCTCKRTSGNCTCNCLSWAGLPILPVSIAAVNYPSCKMALKELEVIAHAIAYRGRGIPYYRCQLPMSITCCVKWPLDGGTRPRATIPTHPHFLSSMGDGQANAFRWRDTSPWAVLSVVLCITYTVKPR